MDITTRAFAALQGHRRFFTGRPCKHGHTVARFTSSGACTACANPLSRYVRAQPPSTTLIVSFDIPEGFTDAHRATLTNWLKESCLPAFLAGCTGDAIVKSDV